MYVYLKPEPTSSSASARYIIEAIYNIVVNNNTIAQCNASYINHGQSYIAGTRPTSTTYTSITSHTPMQQTGQDNYNNNGYCSFNKKSYATGQGVGAANSAYTPSRVIQVSYGIAPYAASTSTSYPHYGRGFRCNMGASNFANFAPFDSSTNVHTWSQQSGGSTSDTTAGYKIGHDAGNDLDSIHMIVNDSTFAIWVVSAGAPTSRDHGWLCVNDLEHNGTYDNYVYSGHPTYCPTAVMWSSTQNCLDNPTLVASSATPTWGMRMPQYLDQEGVLRNSTYSDTNDQYGWGDQSTTYADAPSIFPSPRSNLYSMKGTGGEDIHPLVPVQYVPHIDGPNFYGDPRQGRFINMYRTSNNDHDRGDVILDGSTRYRVFRTHKTGHADKAAAIQNACYAFPEDNVPFA
jgi:hypothetical protein